MDNDAQALTISRMPESAGSVNRSGIRHVVWDWNATLWDDHEAARQSANLALARLNVAPIDEATFQRHYTRPWRSFYETVARRRLADEEWLAAEAEYHRGYNSQIAEIRLAKDALDAVREVAARGIGQSVLSMWRQDLLEAEVARSGLAPYLSMVDGRVRPGGGPKASYLKTHLHTLGVLPAHALVVGDAVDDFDAAREVGAKCVLYEGGTHSRETLSATGVRVAGTLLDALSFGGLPIDSY